jgi:hypothetical protein
MAAANLSLFSPTKLQSQNLYIKKKKKKKKKKKLNKKKKKKIIIKKLSRFFLSCTILFTRNILGHLFVPNTHLIFGQLVIMLQLPF